MTRTHPRIRICADDYGFSPGVSEAIWQLLANRRLDATSVIVLFPEFEADMAALRTLGGDAAIGLHLTLTDHRPLGSMPRLAPDGRLPPLRRLLGLALTGRVAPGEIEAELRRQFDCLQTALGRAPDFIDGHHHVQALPGIRDIVLDFCRRSGTRVRRIDPPAGAPAWRLPAPIRTTALALLGRGLASRGRDLAMNTGLLGVRDPGDRRPYRDLFQRWLAVARPGTVIMCHPGRPDTLLATRDPVVASRAEEHDYLAGPDFPTDLAAAEVNRLA